MLETVRRIGLQLRAGTRSREALLLAGVLALALSLRLVQLGEFPDTVNPDEADNAQDAIQILHGAPPPHGFFGFDWKPQPAFSVYVLAGFLKVFGTSVEAIRLPSALFSTLALIPFYLLLRRQFSVFASIATTVILATELWYLNFSRSGWENVDSSLYMLVGMLLVLAALDRLADSTAWRLRSLFAAAGVCAALGLYGYFGGRVIVLGLMSFLLGAAFFRGERREIVVGAATIAVVAGLLFLPQALTIAHDWDFFNRRAFAVSITKTPEYRAHPLRTMVTQVRRNALGPWVGSVNDTPRYTPAGEPQLARTTGVLVVIGMVASIAVARFRRSAATWLWWAMLVLSWFATQVLTAGTPNGARGVSWIPALVYFAAPALEYAHLAAANVGPVARGVVHATLVAAVAGSAALGVRHYVSWQESATTRAYRQPYVRLSEFRGWSRLIAGRARAGDQFLPVSLWRAQLTASRRPAP